MRVSVFFFCAVFVGCGSNHSAPVNVLTDLSGNWTGMLNSASAQNSRSIDLFLKQNSASLSGPRVMLGITQALHTCDFNGTMSGTVTGSQVTMNLVIPPNPPIAAENLTLAGTLQSSALSGSYTETSGCINGDLGTFQLSPVPSVTNSQWSGTWSEFMSGPIGTASANLVEDSSGNFAGTLTMGVMVGCSGLSLGAQNVTGFQTGLFVLLTVKQPVGLPIFIGGRVNASGKQMIIGGTCNGPIQNGEYMITLNRP